MEKHTKSTRNSMNCFPFVSYGRLPYVNDDGNGNNHLDEVEPRGACEHSVCIALSV